MADDDVPWWADPDPWAWSPDEAAELETKRRMRQAFLDSLPDSPPF